MDEPHRSLADILQASLEAQAPAFLHLDWPGRQAALAAANTPTGTVLRPCPEQGVDAAASRNLFIEGDNLDALKLLQESHAGQVRLIYIDPPYNTGSALLYRDNLSRSNWLSMMCPRLILAQRLLAEDGVICISIGDAELKNILALGDEIFGAANYVNTVSVLAKQAAGASGGGEDKRLKKNIEYIVIFAKSLPAFNSLAHLYTERPLADVIGEMRAAGESWKYTSILLGAGEREFIGEAKDGGGEAITIWRRRQVRRTTIARVCREEGMSEAEAYRKYFSQIFSDTNAQSSIRTRVMAACGRLLESEMLEVEYVPRSGRERGVRTTHAYISPTVRRMIWLRDVASSKGGQIMKKEKLGTFWDHIDYNNVGKEGGVPFPDGKKPVDLLRTCIALYRGQDGVFMDFFAGSGSFGHALMLANAADGGTRRFILVQADQLIDAGNKRYAAAIAFYRKEGIPLSIAAVCKERLRRSGVGFRVWRIEQREAVRQGTDVLDGIA